MKETPVAGNGIASSVIRKTRGICPDCMLEVDSDIVCSNGIVTMEKHCPEHGNRSAIISREAAYYSELSRVYFTIMPRNLTPHFIGVTLTPRCSLNCRICFAIKTLAKRINEISVEDLEAVIQKNPGKEFFLWGLEPTEHPRITAILELLKKYGKEGYVHSHGLKLTDLSFLKKLKDSGLSHLYLQFEGFDDEAYKVIRGRPLLKEKLAVLENLKQLQIPTSLEVVLAKGVNDDEITKVIDYAVRNPFIRQVSFVPLIPFEAPGDGRSKDMIPAQHASLRLIEEKTGGRISLDKLKAFQKLMYVVYRFSRFRKCFYFTSYALIRAQDGKYRTIDELIDLPMAERIIDHSLDKLKGPPGFLFDISLMFKLMRVFFNRKCLGFVFTYLRFVLSGRKLTNSRVAPGVLFIVCNELCNSDKADIGMSERFCQEMTLTKNLHDKLVFKAGFREMIDSYRELFGRARVSSIEERKNL